MEILYTGFWGATFLFLKVKKMKTSKEKKRKKKKPVARVQEDRD